LEGHLLQRIMRENGKYFSPFHEASTRSVGGESFCSRSVIFGAGTGARAALQTPVTLRNSSANSCNALEDQSQLGSLDGRVFDESGAIRSDDVLKHRLSVEPLVDLDAIIKLENRLVDLGRPPPSFVGDLLE